ncbi:MAG: hypothetical protein D6753_18125 [Planctomycetota bacterium]|nr:MAG: hypothetical protein D6753_18125 [Planctomycetota bacterium]
MIGSRALRILPPFGPSSQRSLEPAEALRFLDPSFDLLTFLPHPFSSIFALQQFQQPFQILQAAFLALQRLRVLTALQIACGVGQELRKLRLLAQLHGLLEQSSARGVVQRLQF